MAKTIEATFEDGVFKPKTPVDLEDKATVRLIIESEPTIYDDEEDPSGYKTGPKLHRVHQDCARRRSHRHAGRAKSV